MRKTVAISLDKDLLIKAKMHLLTEKDINFSYFMEALLEKYFKDLEKSKQANKEKLEVNK